jgi:ABC-type uncharacterized transport system permease subunit
MGGVTDGVYATLELGAERGPAPELVQTEAADAQPVAGAASPGAVNWFVVRMSNHRTAALLANADHTPAQPRLPVTLFSLAAPTGSRATRAE